MGYASRSGRAHTNPSNPQAFGVCDRCGIWTNFVNLQWQYDWRGAALQNIYIKVCPECLDVPQEQLRAIVVPADPTPILQARVEPFVADEQTVMGLDAPTIDPVTGLPVPSTTSMETVGNITMTPTPIGVPVGLEQGAVMPLYNDVQYGDPVPVLSIMANGTDQIAVTCSAAHGLSTNNQISVEGLANNLANGFFSVTVTGGTTFTYQTYSLIPSGSLLTSTSNIITCLVGLPYGYAQIPQVGP